MLTVVLTQGWENLQEKVGTLDLELIRNSYYGAPRGPRASPGRLLSLQRNVTNVMEQGSKARRKAKEKNTILKCEPWRKIPSEEKEEEGGGGEEEGDDDDDENMHRERATALGKEGTVQCARPLRTKKKYNRVWRYSNPGRLDLKAAGYAFRLRWRCIMRCPSITFL